MAGAAPTSLSTKETTNYARLCRLLVDFGTQALREAFNAIHPPASLPAVLTANIATLQTLRRKKIINPIQWATLFPAIPTTVSVYSFDITLLMVLFRNLCGLTPPLTGWDALPAVTDQSREADIARVKYFRNSVYGHAENASVDDIKFNNLWQDIQDTLVRLGGTGYGPPIDDLRNECMDPGVEFHYKNLLNEWKKDEDNIKEELSQIKKLLHNLTASKESNDKGEVSQPKDSKTDFVICKRHNNEALKYFCLQCKVCICDICGHDDHTKVDIRQAAEEEKMPMKKTLLEAKAELVSIDSKIDEQTDLRNKSKERIAIAENEVTRTVEELIQLLKDHKKMVTEKLTEIDETQEKDHEAQLENFKKCATKLNRSVKDGEGIFQKSTDIEILQEKHVFTVCKEQLRNSQKMKVYKPEDVNYVVNREIKNAGSLLLLQLPSCQLVVSDHSHSEADGIGLTEAEFGIKTNFTVITRDSEGRQFYSEQEQVSVTVSSSEGDGEVQIIDCKDGSYTVHYKPKSVSQHNVAIEVNGWPLTGSPWIVNVTPHHYKMVKSFGSFGEQEGEFQFPTSVAKDEQTGNIAVADYSNKRIQLFDDNCNYLWAIGGVMGSQTSAAVKLGRPLSVAFAINGDLIVIHASTSSNKMSAINNLGEFIEQFSKYVINPWCVFVQTDCDGDIVVSDFGDRKIKVLTSDGANLKQSFSDPDCHTGPFWIFYHQDMFFVSYVKAHCVKLFNKEGVFLYNIGSEGSGEGQFIHPRGLAVDAFNNLIVCDCDNERLQIFTLDGKFITSFSQEIKEPWTLAACSNGDIMVTDTKQHRLLFLR